MSPSDADRTEDGESGSTRRGVLGTVAGSVTAVPVWVGTLGGSASQERGGDATGPSRQASFDPSVHGFGFPNWFGESGCAVEAEDCPPEQEFTVEYEPPTLPEVREAIDTGWRITPPAAQTELLARIVRYLAAQQLATNGHCYGMTLAAKAYQSGEEQLPDTASVASEVPRPTGQYESVGHRIRTFHSAQLLDSSGFWLSLFALEFGREDAAASVVAATEAIGESGTALLTFGGLEAGHQVIAYDHVREDGEVRFVLYDPELPAAEYAEDSDGSPRELTADADTGELIESPYDYGAWLYNEFESDVDDVEQLLGGSEELFAELDGAVFFQVGAPFELEVDVPDGTTAVALGPPTDVEAPPGLDMGEAALLLDAEPGEYALEVVGAVGEEYSLETYGVADGSVVVDEAVTGVAGDAAERFVLAVEDSGEGTLRRVGEDVAERSDWFSDDRWLYAGGAAAAGLGLGLASRRLRTSSGEGDGTS